ncbi:MAG: hypothetical protein JXK07_08470 [Spirochaetes bacterium]|nr:hypothetical protein [Spirochaetota bacterium]MBN2770946.1 hypothetical protein [Spirochaetota bacterium]
MKYSVALVIFFTTLAIFFPLFSQIDETAADSDNYDPAAETTDISPETDSDDETQDSNSTNDYPVIENKEPETFSGEDRKTRYYTYIGSTVSAGFNSISYSGWESGEQSSIEESGYYFFPSVCAFIIAPPLMGQFNLGFAINLNDSELTSINHVKADARIKYMYNENLPVTLTGGAGFFIEMPPASEKYDGGGALITLGLLHPLSSDWSLLCDFDLGYGYFGKGSEGRKLTYGITIGAAAKVGNL